MAQLGNGLVTVRNSGNTFISQTLDASNDGVAFAMFMPQADTITSLGVRVATIAGTSPTYKIGFQTLGTDGVPDGTYLGGGSEQSGTFAPSATGMQYVTLDNSRTVTRGELVCVVVEYDSGTIDGSNNVSITYSSDAIALAATGTMGMPYSLAQTSGAWTVHDDSPCVGLRSATASYGHAVDEVTLVTVDNDTTPDELGVAFTLPSGTCDSYQVVGVCGRLDNNITTVTSNLTITLYEGTTVLQQVAITGNKWSTTGIEFGLYAFDEVTLSTLSPGTQYVIGLHSDNNTESLVVRHADYLTQGDLQGDYSNFGGLDCYAATRTQPGSWTVTTTRMSTLTPVIIDMTTSGGSTESQQNLIVQNIGTY